MRKRSHLTPDEQAKPPSRAGNLMAEIGERAGDDAIVVAVTDNVDLSDAMRAELRILRAAAAAIDLQKAVGPQVERMAAVQAMIDAAWAVFAELGRGGPGADDAIHH